MIRIESHHTPDFVTDHVVLTQVLSSSSDENQFSDVEFSDPAVELPHKQQLLKDKVKEYYFQIKANRYY